MNLSIVIPVYNGQESLKPLINRLAQVLPSVADAYEVLLINDESQDNSWAVIQSLAKEFSWVQGVDLMTNYGQHNATLCGIRKAQFEVTITMDDDLQHPPEEIPVLLGKFIEGYDVVYGVPRKLPHSWWRNFFSVFTKRIMSRTMGVPTIRDFSAFRVFRTDLRKAFSRIQGPDVIIDVLLSWGTQKFSTVEVDENQRESGKSNYSLSKLIRYTLLVLTSFSTIPLRLANIIGFLFTILGIIGFIYVVAIFLVAGSVPGFPFLASIILIFSGVQLFALGIIGEYLGHVFERTSGRTPYEIASTTADPTPE
ncbi:glycosyltransferase family 2 protein [Chloroflexota bacterium]